MMANDLIEFIKAALRNPLEVSTIFPTSRALAETLLAHGDVKPAQRIVELGAGTGAITRHLLPKLAKKEAYLGIELDPKMVNFLRTTYPSARFETGLAENLPQWVQPASADIVVSSLPWTMFSDETQEKTITAILQALKPGGVFLTYVCSNAILYPGARKFIGRLRKGFSEVYRAPIEWRNIPPAFVFKSTK